MKTVKSTVARWILKSLPPLSRYAIKILDPEKNVNATPKQTVLNKRLQAENCPDSEK